MNRLWLFIDWCITSPFLLLGYLTNAAYSAFRLGWFSYGANYRKAKEGKL